MVGDGRVRRQHALLAATAFQRAGGSKAEYASPASSPNTCANGDLNGYGGNERDSVGTGTVTLNRAVIGTVLYKGAAGNDWGRCPATHRRP